MPIQIFDQILSDGVRKGQLPGRTQESRKWFREKTKQTDYKQKRDLSEKIMKQDTSRLRERTVIGKMYMFYYDPKHKKKLPYYDRFPLIFPIGRYKDGFLGINLHYLQPKLRARLMDALYDTANNKRYDETTKLKISYDILKSAAKYRWFKPCVKRYLTKHVRSRFLLVDSVEWDVAIFLPLARFEKASKTQVWADSRKIISGKK